MLPPNSPRMGFSKSWLISTIVLGLATFCAFGRADDVSVLTAHNDNYRSGANLHETRLAAGSLGGDHFGKLFSLTVDGCVYAQPLVISDVPMPAGGKRNLVIIATEHNSVYGFDADDHSGSNVKPIWQRSFINPSQSIVSVKSRDFDVRLPLGMLIAHRRYKDITPEIGITGTPVIDPDTRTLFFVTSTREPKGYVHRLHALDIATGSDRLPAVVIEGKVKGVGDGTRGGMVPFQPRQQLQRAGLLLSKGVVYVAFGSHNDQPIGDLTYFTKLLPNLRRGYQGWVFAYDAATMKCLGIYNTTPNGHTSLAGLFGVRNPVGAGIWMSGAAPAADSDGNVYVSTANGKFNAHQSGTEYGDSVIKLSLDTQRGLFARDFFTPWNEQQLSRDDLDLGSCGMLLLDRPGAPEHQKLLVGGGKAARVYVMDRETMPRFSATQNEQLTKVVQEFEAVPPAETAALLTRAARAPAPHGQSHIDSRENRQRSAERKRATSQLTAAAKSRAAAPQPARAELHHLHGAPVFWSSSAGSWLYFWPEETRLRAYPFVNGKFDLDRIVPGPYELPDGMPGGMMSLSADGDKPDSGVLWVSHPITGDAHEHQVEGVLSAFKADGLKTLWNSRMVEGDEVGCFAKFCPPTVANGRVYMATMSNQVEVYGRLERRLSAALIGDTYVQAGGAGNSNFGNSKDLVAGKDHCIYLSFDLRDVHELPKNAFLSLTVKTASVPDIHSVDVEVFGTTDSWSEGSITWNTAPSLDRQRGKSIGPFVTSKRVFLKQCGVTFDVSEFVAQHVGIVVTLQIICSDSQEIAFASHEDTDSQWKLRDRDMQQTSTKAGKPALTLTWY